MSNIICDGLGKPLKLNDHYSEYVHPTWWELNGDMVLFLASLVTVLALFIAGALL